MGSFHHANWGRNLVLYLSKYSIYVSEAQSSFLMSHLSLSGNFILHSTLPPCDLVRRNKILCFSSILGAWFTWEQHSHLLNSSVCLNVLVSVYGPYILLSWVRLKVIKLLWRLNCTRVLYFRFVWNVKTLPKVPQIEQSCQQEIEMPSRAVYWRDHVAVTLYCSSYFNINSFYLASACP